MMTSDLEASRAGEVQSLLKEQTQSLLSAYLQKERRIERTSTPQDVTHLMMLSDLVKDMIASYISLDDASLLQMDWLCPLLTSCTRSNDPSIREAVQTILDRALKADDAVEDDAVECNGNDEATSTMVATAEKIVADV